MKEIRTTYERLSKAFTKDIAANVVKKELKQIFSRLANQIHMINVGIGWWHDSEGDILTRNVGELIALTHSEISEWMEGERKDLMDDKLPHRKMAEVEIADAIIRMLDFAGAARYDIGGAIAEKLEYNLQREDHKHESRESEGGKLF